METLEQSSMVGEVGASEHKILCCECGLPTVPNAANMCIACIRLKVDITEGIPKTSQLYWCKFCERFVLCYNLSSLSTVDHLSLPFQVNKIKIPLTDWVKVVLHDLRLFVLFVFRYLQPPNSYIPAALESKELLTICLKKLKPTLAKVRLVDAKFVWTESHSKRIKVRVTIQKEVGSPVICFRTYILGLVSIGLWRNATLCKQKPA